MSGTRHNHVVVSFLITFIATLSALTPHPAWSKAENPAVYRRSDISDARFGEGSRQALLKKSYEVAAYIKKTIFGQDRIADTLQNKLVQYSESGHTRTGEPIALNLIGLPGVGKTAMLTKLKELGFPIVHFDAQRFASGSNDFAVWAANALSEYVAKKLPVILIVEELDKVAEVGMDNFEKTSSLIGTLNQILSDGRIGYGSGFLDLSNIMVITTMNFAPSEMEHFTSEVLPERKSFFDFTIEDFQTFDNWIRNQPSARYKILSRLFRPNTVSRLAPNTYVMEPLNEPGYWLIADSMVKKAIERHSTGANAGKRIRVTADRSVIDFLARETTYAPSGARETVFRSDALIDQLIQFGTKALDPNGSSIDQPRHIQIAADRETGNATLAITPMVNRQGKLAPGNQFEIRVDFDSASKLYTPPRDQLQIEKPQYPKPAAAKERITKKQIRESRFPKAQNTIDDLKGKIGSVLLGQEDAIEIIQDDLNKYFARKGPAKREPSFRVLSGFPGIGKSELAKLSAQHGGIPYVRINMQQFSSDSADTVKSFFSTLERAISEAERKTENGKYILLIEELDKVFEINEKGEVVNRPIMGLIKDLLNDGVAQLSLSENSALRRIDIRSAMTFITMNFAVDLFGFKADPRLTSIEDVIKAWEKMNSTPMAVKQVLGRMFLPETVSRIMSRFIIMKPLDKPSYQTIVTNQSEHVERARLLDEKGRNIGQIRLELSDSYKDYLFSETVIPSEGARNTVVSSQTLIGSDLEKALAKLPKSSKYAAVPLIVKLDYLPAEKSVVASVVTQAEPDEKPRQISKHQVALKFPPVNATGAMKLDRIRVSLHEFGHAFVAVRLGQRIEHVVVVSPNPQIGGYVKFRQGGQDAQDHLVRLYATLASRAFERIFMSEDPMDSRSVLDITSGASMDIKQATMSLFNMLYELGFDPSGGTIDRNFVMNVGKYASYADLPSEAAEKLGLILRDMENALVKELLEIHTRDWYVEKITELARAGAMDEKEFYKLIDYTYPGAGTHMFSQESQIRKIFGDAVLPEKKSEIEARSAQRSDLNTTAAENLKKHVTLFAEIVKNRLHADPTPQLKAPKKGGKCRAAFRK